MFVEDEEADDILTGMVPRSHSWRDDLAWVREASDLGIVMFEGTGWGEAQDELRKQGYLVIGSSALGDRLELDRSFGQRLARRMGLPTAATHAFESFEDAIAFVERTPGRYVLKFDGDGFAKTRNYVGTLASGADVLAMLRLQRTRWSLNEPPRFVLMEHLSGVEVGVGGFFDGTRFLAPVNLDWEHKRFFPGNLGELTGEMGTLVSYRGGERLFAATLGRCAPELAASGYVGYVNMNLIVNEQGAFPLEFTCRFGVPGFAILSALHAVHWDELLTTLVTPQSTRFATHPGYAVGVVLTVPPFPYPDGYDRLSKGLPICFDALSDEERARLHYGEVRMEHGQLVTAGQIGYLMVATGRGASVRAAQAEAYALARKVIVPNLRYRNDIGDAFETLERAELVRLGWLDD